MTASNEMECIVKAINKLNSLGVPTKLLILPEFCRKLGNRILGVPVQIVDNISAMVISTPEYGRYIEVEGLGPERYPYDKVSQESEPI
jgi:hypothetical protein